MFLLASASTAGTDHTLRCQSGGLLLEEDDHGPDDVPLLSVDPPPRHGESGAFFSPPGIDSPHAYRRDLRPPAPTVPSPPDMVEAVQRLTPPGAGM
jgi:hypothetical protein